MRERKSAPAAIRTPDPLLRRQLLYPLSYGGKAVRPAAPAAHSAAQGVARRLRSCAIILSASGCSSVGRALAFQAGCRRFEPGRPLFTLYGLFSAPRTAHIPCRETRGGRIRTGDLPLPKRTRYQTAPHPGCSLRFATLYAPGALRGNSWDGYGAPVTPADGKTPPAMTPSPSTGSG